MNSVQDYPVELQQLIENEIASGKFRPGADFTIAKLGKRFGSEVPRVALVVPSLLRKGLLERVGQKTYTVRGITKAKIESVFQYAQKSKLKPRTIVRGVSIIQANDMLAQKLKVVIGAPVFQQVRTRLVDEKILANQYNFIPFEICPGLENVDLSQRSFQVTLEEDFHTVIARIDESYALGDPMRDDVEILDLRVGEQVLVVQRMSFSSSDMPLVFADIHVNPSQFHYVASLWPDAQNLVAHIMKNGKKS